MPATYDRFARFYDAAFAPFEKRFLAKLRSDVLAMMPADGEILEIGAGTGANFKFYTKCRRAVASELSARMIDLAAGKANTGKSRIDLVQADAQALPFDTNRFDAAFATLVFCSIPDPARAFAELVRTVRPGGRIVLLEHVRPPGMLSGIFDLINVFTVAAIDDHFNRRTPDLAANAGLVVTEVRTKLWGIINLIVCETPALSEPDKTFHVQKA